MSLLLPLICTNLVLPADIPPTVMTDFQLSIEVAQGAVVPYNNDRPSLEQAVLASRLLDAVAPAADPSVAVDGAT